MLTSRHPKASFIYEAIPDGPNRLEPRGSEFCARNAVAAHSARRAGIRCAYEKMAVCHTEALSSGYSGRLLCDLLPESGPVRYGVGPEENGVGRLYQVEPRL